MIFSSRPEFIDLFESLFSNTPIFGGAFTCTSASIEPSHVLTAMGLNEVAAFSSIRFSIGKFNTKKEMDIVIDAVKNVVSDLRAMVN